MVYFIYNPFTENHLFLVNNLKLNLDLFNYSFTEIDQINNEENDNNIYVIIINHMFLIENEKAKNDYQNLLKKKKKFLYITEPIELMIEVKFYNKIIKELRPMKILTYCEENLKKINPLCPYINFYPINKTYFRFVDLMVPKLKEKDLTKIIFIGKMNNYRDKIKDIFKDDLIIIEDKYKKEDWIKIIQKYQYFLNIHRRPNSKCFETMRILPLLYNDCTIISEHVNKKEEEYFEKGNIYFCNLEEMKNKFKNLKNEKLENVMSQGRNISYDKYYKMNKFFM